jgi:NAD(P)-dependent dehydrogenase (short-subunit alcohol dehydrogenase family)
MEIDAVGTFTMSRAAFPALKAAGSAAIINISATLHYGATWYQVHASAAKAAVDSITRSLALEWGEYGVRVNGVAPGPIKGTAGGGRATRSCLLVARAAVVLHSQARTGCVCHHPGCHASLSRFRTAARARAGMSKLAPGEEGSMEQVVTATIPVGHMGDRADIALACVYLASSAGR